LAIGPSEAETFWADFLRSLTRRGLSGVKLVISDAHEGPKAAAAKVLGATLILSLTKGATLPGPLHEERPGPTKGQRLAAAIRTAFVQEGQQAAIDQWRQVSLRKR